jgi:peptide/nickel transport system substrate-binding protein
MGQNTSGDDERFSRRQYLGALAVVTGTGVAGCSGQSSGEGGTGDSSNGESNTAASADSGTGGSGGGKSAGGAPVGAPGERVPTIDLEYWTGNTVQENAVSQFKTDLSAVGIEMAPTAVSFSTQVQHNFEDKRNFHISFWTHGMSPSRLDAFEFTWRFNGKWAGANGFANPTNYANCTHTDAANNARTASGPEERQKFVNEAHAQMSKDVGSIPLCKRINYGAYLTDQVNVDGLGKAAIADGSVYSLIKSSAKGDRPLVFNVDGTSVETKVHPANDSDSVLAQYNNLIYSPLVGYNEDWELTNMLAKEYEVSNDGKTYTFTLRDATFHNGDPVTPEDVVFTYNFIGDNAQAFPKASSPPYDSIEAVDDTTVRFNLKTPFPALVGRVLPFWGVLPKDVWVDGGARDDPTGVDLDPIVGSGPYAVEQWNQGQSVFLTPHDGHPLYQPESDLILRAFSDDQTPFRAFQEGEINMFSIGPPAIAEDIRTNMSNADVTVMGGFQTSVMYPQMTFGPMMFREFREAFSLGMNRKKMNQAVLNGDSEPVLHSDPWSNAHPWYPGEDMLTKIADLEAAPEKAMDVLSEEGWSQDDQGRLRYPDDADLTPLWEQGAQPADFPDRFPCVQKID